MQCREMGWLCNADGLRRAAEREGPSSWQVKPACRACPSQLRAPRNTRLLWQCTTNDVEVGVTFADAGDVERHVRPALEHTPPHTILLSFPRTSGPNPSPHSPPLPLFHSLLPPSGCGAREENRPVIHDQDDVLGWDRPIPGPPGHHPLRAEVSSARLEPTPARFPASHVPCLTVLCYPLCAIGIDLGRR